MLDFIVKIDKKYHPQTLLEECKYEIKKTKMENLINDDLEKSFMMNLIMILMIKVNVIIR